MTADDYRIYCDMQEDAGLDTALLRIFIEEILSEPADGTLRPNLGVRTTYGYGDGEGYGNGGGNGEGYGNGGGGYSNGGGGYSGGGNGGSA